MTRSRQPTHAGSFALLAAGLVLVAGAALAQGPPSAPPTGSSVAGFPIVQTAEPALPKEPTLPRVPPAQPVSEPVLPNQALAPAPTAAAAPAPRLLPPPAKNLPATTKPLQPAPKPPLGQKALQSAPAPALALVADPSPAAPAPAAAPAVQEATPPTLAVVVPAPPTKPSPKTTDRAWLRDGGVAKKKAPVAAAPASPIGGLRLLALGVLLAAIAGVAFYVRRRRGPKLLGSTSGLRVMTAARVGSKAQVVVVSVAGRQLLLGVTDSHVNSLGWLDEAPARDELAELDPALRIDAPAFSPPAQVRSVLQGSSVGRRAALEERIPGVPRRFRDVLLSALGHPEPPAFDSAASVIAAATEDVITRSAASPGAPASGAPQMVDVEGQARGLVLRLQKQRRA